MWQVWEIRQVRGMYGRQDRYTHSFGGGDLKGKNHLEDLRVDGRIILK